MCFLVALMLFPLFCFFFAFVFFAIHTVLQVLVSSLCLFFKNLIFIFVLTDCEVGDVSRVATVLALLRSCSADQKQRYLRAVADDKTLFLDSTNTSGSASWFEFATPLHIAARNNHREVVALLLNAGVPVRKDPLFCA